MFSKDVSQSSQEAKHEASGAHGTATAPLNGAPDHSGALAMRHAARDGANGDFDLNDPQTRLLVEKMLVALTQDGALPAEKSQSRFNFASYLVMVRRRWLPMLAVFAVTTCMIAWRLRPGTPRYSATATMLLPSATSQLEESNDPLNTGILSDALGKNVATKIAMVTSPPVVAEALSRLDGPMRQRGWGDPKAQTAPVAAAAPVSPDLVDITVVASDPEAAQALANKLIDVYVLRTKQLVRSSYEDSLQFLGDQKAQAEKLLLQAKRELQDFRERTGILSMDARLAATAGAVTDLEKEAQTARLEAAAGVAGQTVQGDHVINDLQQKAAAAKSQYDAVLRDFLPDAPEARRARQEWQAAQRLLDQRTAAVQHGVQERVRSLDTRLSQARRAAAALPATEFKLSQLDSKVKLLEATYETLSDRYTAMKLARYNKLSTATTLTPATNAVPVGRTWAHAIIVAVLCALILAGLVAALLEQLDNTVHSADQLEPLLGAPVLGTLPLLESAGGVALSALLTPGAQMPALKSENQSGDPQETLPQGALPQGARGEKSKRGSSGSQSKGSISNLLLESCRIVRTNLMFSAVDTPLRSVLITSSNSSEGKSFCALNLAALMAYDGKRVILLDCDLRRPTQHRLSNLPLIPGFTNALIEPEMLDRALHPTAVENLWVMTAGAIPPNPPELLGSDHSRRLIAELQDRCDLLIIDSPPVLSLTDAQVLSTIVDGVLLIVSADTTSAQHIQHAQANIRHAGGRLLGSVFNKIKPHNDPYGYYGYYKYGYYKYYSYEGEGHSEGHNGGVESPSSREEAESTASGR